MKRAAHYLGILAATIALQGCVGYNHTLFVTKSNVGLDFDTKPPTAEVTISRREGVLAPAFEGGHTPPVMASFATRNGLSDSFTSFFFGVNQTFAGSDAAVAMSKLYADPNIGSPDLTKYDSSFNVSKPPPHSGNEKGLKHFLFGLPGPGEVKPFIFGTDTALGVKVVWTGDTAYVPDAVKIGFNRKEFALAPIFITNNSSIKMPSFLATVYNDATAKNTDLSVGTIQYFATGDAATLLALQPGVRVAMLQRADPLAAKKAEEYEKKADALINADKLKIEKIIAYVKDPAGNVKQFELTQLTPGTGLNAAWVNSFAGQPVANLQAGIEGPYRGSLDGLYKNVK